MSLFIESNSKSVSAAVHAAVAVTVDDTALTGSLDLGDATKVKNFEGELMFVCICTASSGTLTSLSLKIQDSADNSTFADVNGTNGIVSPLFGSSPNNTCVTFGAGKSQLRRYVRLSSRDIIGTTPSYTISAYAVYGVRGQVPQA